MSDLISRSIYKSKLLKALDVLNKEYREAMLNEDDDLILAIKNQQSAFMLALTLLDNEPTAYSVEKVIKELEENAGTVNFIGYGTIYEAINKDVAIEIVQRGGVSDDMCKWEYISGGEFIQNPHTNRLYSNEPSMKNVYCNTCGKKIKVVE